MAAFEDRRGPDLDQFLGRKWTDWLNAIQSPEAKQQSSSENTSKRDVEVARLRKTDMGLFGYQPATDKFFLAVCEHCGQLMKPQSLNTHYERKHKSKRILRLPAPTGRRSGHGHLKAVPKLNHCIPPPENIQKPHPSHNAVIAHQRPTSHSIRHPGSSRLKVPLKGEASESKESSVSKGFIEPSPKNHRPEKAGTKLIPPLMAKVHPPGNHDNLHKTMQGKVSGKTIKMSDIVEKETSKPTAHHSTDLKHHHRHHHKTVKSEPSRPISVEASRNIERRLSDKSNAEVLSPSAKTKRVYHTHHHHHHQPQQDSSSDGGNVSSDFSDAKSSSGEQRIQSKDIATHSMPLVMLDKTQVPNMNPSGMVKLGNQGQKRSRQPSGGPVSPSSPPRHKMQILHNPANDKPSTADVGAIHHVPNSVLPMKPKKKDKRNIPLKAREYDPNRHCGVWLAEDNSRCRRSLTCKVHPLSAKRSVPGRRKPYNELVQEHGREKQRLKEKNLAAAAGAVPVSPSNALPKPSPKPPEFVVPSASVGIRLKCVPSTTNTMTTASATTSQITVAPTKAKNSLNLFPKNFAPWRVDCWEDQDDVTEDSPKSQHSCVFIYRHPEPLATCRFSARRFGGCQVSYNRKLERQLDTLSSNIHKFGAKTQKSPKPMSFTPISPATAREVSAKMTTPLPPSHFSKQAVWKNQVSLPHTLTQAVESQGNRGNAQFVDVSNKQPAPESHLPSKAVRTNVVRKSSAPARKEHRVSLDTGNAVAADIRNRSKSEQVANMLRRTISGGGDAKRGTTWSVPQLSEPMSTSNYFMNDTLRVNNLSPSPSTISSSPTVMPAPTDNSLDVICISARNEDQVRLKKTNEKRKNSVNRSPKPSSHKVNSKSAIAKYAAIQQGLVNSFQTEQLDSGQITVQLPNGINSVSSNSLLLKPGSHSVTLSGNIGALTVAGDNTESLSTFAGSQISKRLKNMNSNNNFITQNPGVSLPMATSNTKHFPQLQQQNMVQHTELSQVAAGMSDGLVLQGDEQFLLPQSYGQELGNGGSTNLLNQFPNYVETPTLDQQHAQAAQSPDILSLLRQPSDQSPNCDDLRSKLEKHNIQLANLAQLDLGKVMMNVNNNPSMHGQYIVSSDGTAYDLLQSASVDLTTCSSSANANRTSDISQNFITQ